jgi:hypothetical protein
MFDHHDREEIDEGSLSHLDDDEIEMGQSVVSITLNVPSPTASYRGRKGNKPAELYSGAYMSSNGES